MPDLFAGWTPEMYLGATMGVVYVATGVLIKRTVWRLVAVDKDGTDGGRSVATAVLLTASGGGSLAAVGTSTSECLSTWQMLGRWSVITGAALAVLSALAVLGFAASKLIDYLNERGKRAAEARFAAGLPAPVPMSPQAAAAWSALGKAAAAAAFVGLCVWIGSVAYPGCAPTTVATVILDGRIRAALVDNGDDMLVKRFDAMKAALAKQNEVPDE